MTHKKGFEHGRAHSKETVNQVKELKSQGMSVATISKLTGVSVNTLKHWFYRKEGNHCVTDTVSKVRVTSTVRMPRKVLCALVEEKDLQSREQVQDYILAEGLIAIDRYINKKQDELGVIDES